MNIDEQLQELSRQTCPKQVDVVDAVMAQVRQHPYMINNSLDDTAAQSSDHRKVIWRRIALTAAAAAVAVVVFNISLRPSYNEEQIGDMVA
jgi:anti-sigma-K factor RskA